MGRQGLDAGHRIPGNARMDTTGSILERIGGRHGAPRAACARPPVPVLGKCEFLNPGGSVKDRIALAILDDAERRPRIAPGATLIEATAGNTGMGLALVAAARGYRLVCVMPEKMSADKRAALAAVGAEVVIVPNAPPSSPDNFQNVARRMAVERDWFLTEQFANPANPRVHEATTGPEILEQCGGRVGAFVSGVGTGGTITGVGRFLKAHCPGVRIILADPIGSRLAHLVIPRTRITMRIPGRGDRRQRDAVRVRSRGDRCGGAGDRRGIVCHGPPAGPRGRSARRGIIGHGGRGGAASGRGGCDGPVVAILADSWDRYLSRPWLQLAERPST